MGPVVSRSSSPLRLAAVLALLLAPVLLSGCFFWSTSPGAEQEKPSGDGTVVPGDTDPATLDLTGLRITRDLTLDLTGLTAIVSPSAALQERLTATVRLHAGTAALTTAGLFVTYTDRSGALRNTTLGYLANGPTLAAGASVTLPDADPFTSVALTTSRLRLHERNPYAASPWTSGGLGLAPATSTGGADYRLESETVGEGNFSFTNATRPANWTGFDSMSQTIRYLERGVLNLTYDGAATFRDPGRAGALLSGHLYLWSVPLDGPSFLHTLAGRENDTDVAAGFEVRDLNATSLLGYRLGIDLSGQVGVLHFLGGEVRTNASVTTWLTGPPSNNTAADPCYGKTREDRCRFEPLYTGNATVNATLPAHRVLTNSTYNKPVEDSSLLTLLLGRDLVTGDRVTLKWHESASSPVVTHRVEVRNRGLLTVPAGTFTAHNVSWSETRGNATFTTNFWLAEGTHTLLQVARTGPPTPGHPGTELLRRLSLVAGGVPGGGAPEKTMLAQLERLTGVPSQSPGMALLIGSGIEGVPGFNAPFASVRTLLAASSSLSGLPPGQPGRPEVLLNRQLILGEMAQYEVLGAPEGLKYRDLFATVGGNLLYFGSTRGAVPEPGTWVAVRDDVPLGPDAVVSARDTIRIMPPQGRPLVGSDFLLTLTASGNVVFRHSPVS